MSELINELILTVGAWNDSGQKDKRLELQFDSLLNELREASGTTPEGAVRLLEESLSEREVAA